MANVQKQFEQFHENIRTDYETNEGLRDKRDILIGLVERSLQKTGRPSFERLMQGSYIMRTGVMPVAEKEYDIDVGLRFKIKDSDYSADEVRKWVFEAVADHTRDTELKGPCVRVRYAAGYHVDLVAYAWWKDDSNVGHYKLAHKRGWVDADPKTLISQVDKAQDKYRGTDGTTQTTQLRRVIRYLKRWDDVWQTEETDAKPSGLAYTLLCIDSLQRTESYDGKPDDRLALHAWTAIACRQSRLIAKKPTPEYEDMFGRISNADMEALKDRLGVMRDALAAAGDEPDPVAACEKLCAVFGPDFPVPPPDETGRKSKAPAIITSSTSGRLHTYRA
jgi:hypothetical protein